MNQDGPCSSSILDDRKYTSALPIPTAHLPPNSYFASDRFHGFVTLCVSVARSNHISWPTRRQERLVVRLTLTCTALEYLSYVNTLTIQPYARPFERVIPENSLRAIFLRH